ncbi:MAG TPA: MFS transporter [Polyangiaceae bacterium]|jgi:MFS family permease
MSTRPSLSLAAPSTGSTIASETLLTRPFVLLLCVHFFFSFSWSAFLLLPKYLTQEFHASSAVIGAASSINLFAGVALTPLVGALIDRGARRPMIFWGTLLHGLLAAGFAWIHTVGAPLYVMRALLGVVYVLVFNADATLAADMAPPQKLGQAIGLCGVASVATNALAPSLGEVVADHWGWGWVFLLAGASSWLAMLLALGIREPDKDSLTQSSRETGASALSLIFDSARFGAFACAAAAGAAFGALFTFTQAFALSLGAKQVSGFFVGYTASALFVRILLGNVADNLGRRRVVLAALVLYGIDATGSAALRPALLPLLGAGLGLAHGFLYPALNAIAAEGVPRARRGAVMSYFSACFFGGFAIWVYGLGWLAKSSGYSLVFLLSGALVWCSILVLPRARGVEA